MSTLNKLDRNYSLEEIDALAKTLINTLTSKFILLYGDMGVGKTTLIKALAKALGCVDDVQSPTYAIVNEYKTKDDSIYHFDLYRVEDLEEAYNFGIEEYLYTTNWVIIEWPDVIESLIPEDAHRVYLTTNDDGSRKIIF